MDKLPEPEIDYDDESDDWTDEDQQVKDSKIKVVSNLCPIVENRESNDDKQTKNEREFIEIKDIDGKGEEKDEADQPDEELPEIIVQTNTNEDGKDKQPSSLNLHENVDLLNSIAKMINGKRRSFKMKRRRSKKVAVEDKDSCLEMYNEERQQLDESQIFENIQLQKEIISSVRSEPWQLVKKYQTVKLAKSYVERYEGKLSKSHGYQEAGAKIWHRIKRIMSNIIVIFIPWEMRIKTIESHFGSVVASYFTFARWLFWVNFMFAVVTISFIVVPEIIVGEDQGTALKTVPPEEKDQALDLASIWDFEGYLKYSPLFYGYYGNTEMVGGFYRGPLAYFLTGISIFVLSFVVVLLKMSSNASLSRNYTSIGQLNFTWKAFASWDYTIGNAETAKNKTAEIVTVLRETIIEEKERQRSERKGILILLRIWANFIVVLVLASSAYAIYLVVERSRQFEKDKENGVEVNWWQQNEVSIVMSLITALFPSIFEILGMIEKYHPRINLRWSLARILVLYLLNLYTLTVALYGKIVNKRDDFANRVSPTSSFNETTTLREDKSKLICWETMVGQEFFKLTVFDLFITLGMIFVIDFLRDLIVRYANGSCCWDLEKKFPEYGEFKLAENILHLIYNQAMIWMGMFFAPLLAVGNLIKIVILFYVRSWAVLVCNIPLERVFKVSKSNNFYFVLLLIMLFLVCLPVAFLLVQLRPSPDCGPLRFDYERSYYVLTSTIVKEFPEFITKILDYIASPGIICPLIVLLIMIIQYLYSLSRSLRTVNNDLKAQLQERFVPKTR
ncbi:DgyrCDS4755 [Dimorphilus gyrociliatus]|uniref:DgyrCDS4755 n=1 Tax=Dimorphilus gyrociliatus TaxID=2664684 RepID=A0A7I8VML5_9ANNE|nr:DgyrCDS4755 [Dimorphilus gyrociliatus]